MTTLLDIVQSAKTPKQRLAAVTLCFLTGRFPMGFRYRMETWGAGPSLKALADADMRASDHTCGTAGCIAGLANFLFTPEESILDVAGYFGMELLGLSLNQRGSIFTPDNPWDNDTLLYDVLNKHPVQVGRVLAHFMYTGKIDWSLKRRQTPVVIAGHRF